MPFKRRNKILNKSTLTSLQGGERSCACMASYNFQPTLQLDVIIPNLEVECKREGVNPVRETISTEFTPNPLHDRVARLGGGGKIRLA